MTQSTMAHEITTTVPHVGDIPHDPAAWTDRKATAQAHRAASARHSSGRRRFIDPTTCDRDYSKAEREFMEAMQAYKLKSGRMFPTWSEVLEVLIDLGYEKTDLADGGGQILA